MNIVPATHAAAPPTIIHIERSDGFPVKTRETSDPKDCDSLNPKINNTTPSAKIAKPMTLFMLSTFHIIAFQTYGGYTSAARNARSADL